MIKTSVMVKKVAITVRFPCSITFSLKGGTYQCTKIIKWWIIRASISFRRVRVSSIKWWRSSRKWAASGASMKRRRYNCLYTWSPKMERFLLDRWPSTLQKEQWSIKECRCRNARIKTQKLFLLKTMKKWDLWKKSMRLREVQSILQLLWCQLLVIWIKITITMLQLQACRKWLRRMGN